MKQTAVEFIYDKFIQNQCGGTILPLQELFEYAKEMEKQQIINAHFEGVKETVLNLSEHIDIPKTLNTIQEIENGIGKHEEGEQYYNEQFKNK